MGKPYEKEMGALQATYAWATAVPIEQLTSSIRSLVSSQLMVVGSGGSLTAAYLASGMHQQHTGQLAKPATPLEAVAAMLSLNKPAVLLISAGGRNPDVIGAFKAIVSREPSQLLILCAQQKSPLVEAAAKYRSVEVCNFDLPNRKDGFLATNSLLAFSILIARAYRMAFASNDSSLPNSLDELLWDSGSLAYFNAHVADLCRPLWSRKHLIVLYGTAAAAGAIDLESKFTEAALGTVQLSDYRNFAHGRHHWLAKRGDETGVIAFVTRKDRKIADETLKLLPTAIPVSRFDMIGDEMANAIASIVTAFLIVGDAGKARGIDPGRPHVASFGRKIYRLRGFNGSAKLSTECQAIERKLGPPLFHSLLGQDFDYWRSAYRSFMKRLTSARFGAIVCDYDGTLCDQRDRNFGINNEIAEQLDRVLQMGLYVGIATGRGKSVRKALRQSLRKNHWSRVLIGYYNSADMAFLSDGTAPCGDDNVVPELSPMAERMKMNAAVQQYCECSFRKKQITVIPKFPAATEIVWNIVQEMVYGLNINGVTLSQSSHSIDITAPGVSKRHLVEEIRKSVLTNQSLAVLCIGDKGQWPGNDFDLLREPYSLSVSENSSDPDTCWNLAPSGYRGVQSTQFYLQCLRKVDDESARFSLMIA